MLALRELGLSHFRSHKVLRLSLDGRPVALHGRNGSGKTNILEAVSMLSPGRGLRGATGEQLIRRPETVGWKVTGTLQSLQHKHELETWLEPGSSRHVRVDGKHTTQIALGRIARIVWLVPMMDRLWVEGAEGRRRFLDRLTMSFEPAHAEAVLTYEKAMRERNRLLKDGQRDAHWYGALETQMAAAGVSIIENRQRALELIALAQTASETSFPTAELSIVHPEGQHAEQTSDQLRQMFCDNRSRDIAAGRTLLGPHRADLLAVYVAKNVAARDCSTGEQKALLVSLILANARALSQSFGAPAILLLDEVAAHLDLPRRRALYDEICALGAQAFMTGTGIELFEDLGTRAAHFEVSDTGGMSQLNEVNL